MSCLCAFPACMNGRMNKGRNWSVQLRSTSITPCPTSRRYSMMNACFPPRLVCRSLKSSQRALSTKCVTVRVCVCLGSSFPPGFIFLIQKVFVMLFRMLAHLFSTHYQDAIAVELHPQLNTLFTHFITFSHTFRLLEASETAPIDEIIALLTHWNAWKVTQKDTSVDLETQMWYSVASWTQRTESPHQMHYFGQ